MYNWHSFTQLFLLMGLPLSVAITAFTFVYAVIDSYRIRRRYAHVPWKAKQAVVVRSQLDYHEDSGHEAIIEYRYEYAGKPYSSTCVSADEYWAPRGTRKHAEKWVALHPPGSYVTAYVDQEKPERAVLFPEFRNSGLLTVEMVFFMFGVGNSIWLAVFLFILIVK